MMCKTTTKLLRMGNSGVGPLLNVRHAGQAGIPRQPSDACAQSGTIRHPLIDVVNVMPDNPEPEGETMAAKLDARFHA